MNSSFDAYGDAQKFKDAISSKDEKVFIENLPFRKNAQLQEIRSEYKKLSENNTDIISDIESNFQGDFKELLVALFNTPIDFDCYQLRKAVKGLGTNEETLIEILTTRPPEIITQIKSRYEEIFPGRTLEKDIKGDTSGHFLKLLLSLLEADRSQNNSPDMQECENLAKKLYEAGEKKLGTDEAVFTEIFTKKSKNEFKAIAYYYQKLYGHSVIQAVDKEFSFDSKKCLNAISYGILSPNELFAQKIHKAVSGFLGKDNNLLIRIAVTKREKDMGEIKQYYKQIFHKSLTDEIKEATKGKGSYSQLLADLYSY